MTRILELACIAAIVALAFFLRTQEIGAYRLSPDDGQYMHSARLHELERGGSLATWIAEDREWIGELVEDWGRYDDRTTYQHSYLHQFVFRYLYRFGLARIDALRLSSALGGTLACLVLVWLYRRFAPQRRWVGVLAALLVAVGLMHVFFARTGWGETGTATFLLVWIGLVWRHFTQLCEDEPGRLGKSALALCAVSLLAMGYHEMTSAYIVCGTLIVLLLVAWRTPVDPESWRELGFVARALRSRRVWTYVLACVPAGLYTLALLLYSEFAQKRWFASSKELLGYEWGPLRIATLQRWWRWDLVHWISIPILALAAFGAWRLRARDRAWGRYLVAWALVPFCMYFLVFNDPTLERVYLPVLLVLFALAAEGIAALFAHARSLPLRFALGAATLAFVAWLGATSWDTVLGGPGTRFFQPGIYIGQPDSRYVDRPWIEYLEDHAIRDELGVWPAKDPLFVALDAGFQARLFSFNEPLTTWTPYLLAVQRSMLGARQRVEDGGRYRLLVSDRVGKVGLYALVRAEQ